MKPFRDRVAAGRFLAERLLALPSGRNPLVLALPRGGVPVACEIAAALSAPLDLFLVRKLGVPGHEELAMGAIAAGGIRVINQEVVDDFRIKPAVIEQVAAQEISELNRRQLLYRGARPPIDAAGMDVILVDDGLATGSTMLAAIAALRQQSPASITVAVPVSSVEACRSVGAIVDQIVCGMTPQPFHAVGLWYENFEQTSDDEVRELLQRFASRGPTAS